MSGTGDQATGAAVAILAGGRARRLGGAKATAKLGGRPLIAYPVGAALSAGLETVVVAKSSTPLPELGCELAIEPDDPSHPLLGIVTALRRPGAGSVVAVACDLPFVPAPLLAWLAELEPEGGVMPRLGAAAQPLLARYTREQLPLLERGLERRAPMRRVVETLDPRIAPEAELSRFGDPARIFFNVNGPADLARAAAMLERT